MLFHSIEFLFFFLPLTLFFFYFFQKTSSHQTALHWLLFASIVFYAWWSPKYLLLLGASLIANYFFGSALTRIPSDGTKKRKTLLILSVAFNLGLLAYYKYLNFFIDNVNAWFNFSWHIEKIILPLGISFFTFQALGYVIDCYRHPVPRYRFDEFCLFILFFPQLIAGPIVLHEELMPQLHNKEKMRFRWDNLAFGAAIFSIGVFKKSQLADRIAPFAQVGFNAVLNGKTLPFHEAWFAVMAYTIQIYFDFSGYSDMAIGLGRMFGLDIPINFNSPYKAASIIEFWRRWHITLSRFLRDYLYIPLGGNRQGSVRRYTNLMLTMALGGLWHGASWNFLIWGMLQGVYLIVNHAWRRLRPHSMESRNVFARSISVGVTLFFVMCAWVFFRAESFEPALSMLKSMFYMQQSNNPSGMEVGRALKHIIAFSGIIFLLPNTQTWFKDIHHFHAPASSVTSTAIPRFGYLKISMASAVILGFMMAISTAYRFMGATSEFLYFQF